MVRERRMLDEVDIINDRLSTEIEKLSKELTVLRERHEVTHANLEQARNQLKANQEIKARLDRLVKDYEDALKTLRVIATGEAKDPATLARKKLEDLE